MSPLPWSPSSSSTPPPPPPALDESRILFRLPPAATPNCYDDAHGNRVGDGGTTQPTQRRPKSTLPVSKFHHRLALPSDPPASIRKFLNFAANSLGISKSSSSFDPKIRFRFAVQHSNLRCQFPPESLVVIFKASSPSRTNRIKGIELARRGVDATRRWIAAASGVVLATAAVRIWPIPRRRRGPGRPRPRLRARRRTPAAASARRCCLGTRRAAWRGRARGGRSGACSGRIATARSSSRSWSSSLVIQVTRMMNIWILAYAQSCKYCKLNLRCILHRWSLRMCGKSCISNLNVAAVMHRKKFTPT